MSSRGTVVIVTGSRKWTDEDVIHERLSRYVADEARARLLY